MTQVIYVPQGRTARFIIGESDINGLKGLCTAEFHNCNILVLISADKKKVSLTHADIATNKEFIETEINWAGIDCEKIVVLRENESASEDFEKIFSTSRFKEKLVKKVITDNKREIYALSVLGTTIHFHTNIDYEKMSVLQYPIARISCLRNFNIFYDAFARNIGDEQKLLFTRLIFDVNSWEPASKNDINPSLSLHKVLSIDGRLAHENPKCSPKERIKKTLTEASKDRGYIRDFCDDAYVNLFEMYLQMFIEEVIKPNNAQYVECLIELLLANQQAKNFVNQSTEQLFQIFQNKKLSDYKGQSEHLLSNFLVKIESIEKRDQLIFRISYCFMLQKHQKNLKELEECFQVQAAIRVQSLFRGYKSRILFTEFKEVKEQYKIAKTKYDMIRHKLLGP